MKKLLIGAFALLFTTFITSCDGTKKTSENQSAGTQSTEQTDSKTESPVPADVAKTEDEKLAGRSTESLTGDQLVSNAANRLVTKLVLNEQQITSLNGILMKTFLDTGGDIKKTYTAEESRTMGRDIVLKSKDAINGILDQKQKDQFAKFGQHQ